MTGLENKVLYVDMDGVLARWDNEGGLRRMRYVTDGK